MSDRLAQVNQLIRKELAQIMLKEVDFPESVLVTLTRVETTPNLIEAKVYISVMPARRSPCLTGKQVGEGGPENQIEQVFKILNKQIYFLQQKLNNRLKMRPIPKIMFVEEKATREAGKVEELLAKIHKDNA